MKSGVTPSVLPVVPNGEVRSIRLSLVSGGERRLDAEAYLSGGSELRGRIEKLSGAATLHSLADIWQPGRLKGILVESASGEPFLAATQVFDIEPIPRKWLAASKTKDIAGRYVHPGWILVTCSGSVGDTTVAHRPHNGIVISHDLLRVVPRKEEDRAYLYTFLRTRYARQMMRGSKYGNVIKHLEPEHLFPIPVPTVGGEAIRASIREHVDRAFALRDEAFGLMRSARDRFADTIGPVIEPDMDLGFKLRAAELNDPSRRMDAASFNPKAVAALNALRKSKRTIEHLRDVATAFGVKRFKHVYTDEGLPYLDSEDLFEVNPETRKFIPATAKKDADDYYVHVGWLLMACSGQVYGVNGSVVLAGRWHENKIVSNHVIRIVPKPEIRPGYLLMAITHPTLGRPLVTRLAFGTEVPEIDPDAVPGLPVVRLGDVEDQIADLVERAASLRAEADSLEDAAVALVESAIGRALGDISEDAYDAVIARHRLAEIERDPKQALRGKALERALDKLES